MSVNALAEAVREGKEVLVGEAAVTASVAVATQFAIIDAVVVTQKIGTAPGLGASVYTYDVSNNVVTIYAWKPTSATDPTLIAATVETNVSYTIVGRRR